MFNTPVMRSLVWVPLVMLVAAPAWAQKKIEDLKYPPLNRFEIAQPEKVVLDNGMQLYLLEDHALPLVEFSVRLACGSYLEPANKVGLASITGNVMRTGGTENMTGDDIDAALEAIGATVETGIGQASGYAYGDALTEYSETMMRILADILRRPVFESDKIELAKTEQRAGISRRNDDPMGINTREFFKLVYGPESPYARHTEYATIEAVTRDDLVAFHQRYVQPQGVQLAVWGDFQTSAMTELVERYFADWPPGAAEIPDPPEVQYDFKPTVNYAEKTDVNQSNIFIGHIGGQMGDPDYPATIVMNSILGGAFGSRLFGQVRTTEGLAYAVSGTYTFRFGRPGFFYVFVSTKSGSTVQAIESCMREVKRMQTDPPTEEEMRRAKDGWLNAFVFNFDTQSEILDRLMTYDYYGFPADYLQQIKEGVESVTPEDIVAVAQRKLHPDALQIMVTGKADEFDRPLSDLGPVNVIDITIPGPPGEDFVATDEELARGQELLARAVEACGGLDAFRNVESIRRESKVAMSTPQGAMTLDVASLVVFPSMSRQVVRTPMGDQVVVYHGREGWMTMAGQTQMLPAGQIDDMVKDLERNLIWIFRNADDPYFKVAAKGTIDLAGQTVLRLDFLTASGTSFKMYLDPNTYRPAGMRYMGETPAGPAETLDTYGEFTRAADIWMPGATHREAGPMTFDVELVKAEFNVDYNEIDFQKPDDL
jgi:predicted Zn-dependent peptidase